MFRKILTSTITGGIVSATALTMLAGATAVCAEPAANTGKAWVDPGAVERSKTQGAAPEAQTPGGVTTEPAVKEKIDTAAEKEKLKEIIQKLEKSGDRPTAQAEQAIERKRATRVAHAPRKTARHVGRRRPNHVYAYDSLPNKKDGPAPAQAAPLYDPFTGYAQPIRAAY